VPRSAATRRISVTTAKAAHHHPDIAEKLVALDQHVAVGQVLPA
jgi:hypothetical protein